MELTQLHRALEAILFASGERIELKRLSEVLEADAKGAVQRLRQMGITKAEAIGLIERYWEEEV